MRSGHVVVVGAGRLGRTLGARLSAAGESVILVDHAVAALERTPPEFTGFKVRGDAAELETLRRADMGGARLVFATTERDNLNLMVAQAARHIFKVERVLARVSDPSREGLYSRLGVLTVNPTALAAEACLADLPSRARE